MLKKFVGLILLSASLVACGSKDVAVPAEAGLNKEDGSIKAQAQNCRKVEFKGNFYVIDDDAGSDFKRNYPLKKHVILCKNDYQRRISFIKKHGDEMRVEFHGTVYWANYNDPNNMWVKVTGRVDMYEGWNTDNKDRDGFDVFPTTMIPPTKSRTISGNIKSEEWNDDSSVDYWAHIFNRDLN